MKLYSLGETCTVLEWRGLRIMFDCGLHLPSMQRFLPSEAERRTKGKKDGDENASKKARPSVAEDATGEIPFARVGNNIFIEAGSIRFRTPEWDLIDLAGVDVILISNAHNMLALPFITQHSAFRGRVYATEPTVHIASMMMQEIVKYAGEMQYPEEDPARWQNEDFIAALLPDFQAQLADALNWRSLYGRKDIEETVSKVNRVSYHQHINLFGVMEAVPVSSGFSLGSANWILRTNNEKQLRHDDHYMSYIGTPFSTEYDANTLRGGGSILLPCNPAGVIFDLIEVLHTFLHGAGFPRVPMYFVSPMAAQALAYSNICAEWLSKAKQDKAYLPEWPFIHADLQQSGRLQHYTGVSDPGFAAGFKEPCVVFCGHPSLRCGDVLHFINTWGNDPRNGIILTEPGFDYVAGLSPFEGIKCRTSFCPIDPRLNFAEVNAIIGTHLPATLVVPSTYIADAMPGKAPDPSASIIAPGHTITFRPLDVIALPSHRKQARASLSAELARSLKLQKLDTYGGKPGENVVAMAPLSAILSSKDHKLDLQPLSTDLSTPSQEVLLGAPAIDAIVLALAEQGVQDVHVEHSSRKRTIQLVIDSLSASVKLGPTKTKITTSDERTRQMLLDIVTTHAMPRCTVPE